MAPQRGAGRGSRRPRSFLVELVGEHAGETTAYRRLAERARTTKPGFVRRVASAPTLGRAPGLMLPPPQQYAARPVGSVVSPHSVARPQSAAVPGRPWRQQLPAAASQPQRRPLSAAGPSAERSLALDARAVQIPSAAVARPIAAQQRAKEYALAHENSKLSQLQPEPEREPDDSPVVNVLDDDTMAELLFQEIDEDGSGTLDWGEIDALAKQLGKPLSEEELTAAMQEMDEDGNGTVEFDEFLAWYKKSATANDDGDGAQQSRPAGAWAELVRMRSDYYFECISGRTEKRDALRKQLDKATAVELNKAPAPPTPQELAAREAEAHAEAALKQRELSEFEAMKHELEAMKRRLRDKGHGFTRKSWSQQLLPTKQVERCPIDVITPTAELPRRRPASAIRLTERKHQQQQQKVQDTHYYTTADVDRWLEEDSDDDSTGIGKEEEREEIAERRSDTDWDNSSEDEEHSAYSISAQPSGPWGWMPTEHRRQLAMSSFGAEPIRDRTRDWSQRSSSAPQGCGVITSRSRRASSAGPTSTAAPSRRHRHSRSHSGIPAGGGLVSDPVWPESEVLVSQVVQQFMYRELQQQQQQQQQQRAMEVLQQQLHHHHHHHHHHDEAAGCYL